MFTRDLVVKKKRPVLVFIHGGNFVRGSAADYDPDYIMDQEVVLVTVNYRLGMFGFLSTEDEHAPGNYGMLDQVRLRHNISVRIVSIRNMCLPCGIWQEMLITGEYDPEKCPFI